MKALKALIVSADHFEDSELLFPFYRLQAAGLKGITVDNSAFILRPNMKGTFIVICWY